MKMLWALRALQRATIGILLAVGSQEAHAENLKPIDVFKRCYIRMVRSVPVETDALYTAVASGAKTADVACLELFDRAQFGSNGILKARTSEESKAIVRTFQSLHASWFQSKTNSLPASSKVARDYEEAPLYYTRAAFQPGVPFSSVVTLNAGLKGIRDQDTYPTELKDFEAQRVLNYNSMAPFAKETDLILSYTRIRVVDVVTKKQVKEIVGGKEVTKTVDIHTKKLVNDGVLPLRRPQGMTAEFGQLVGVKAADPIILDSFRSISSTNPDIAAAVDAKMVNFNANEHLGGGILGSQAFLANNVNLPRNVLPDTYALINRRLAARVFEDLLCHTLPTLTDDDVKTEVKPASEHTFQQNSSCMRCHSGIDGMAYGYRNVFTFISAPNPKPEDSVGLFFEGMTALKPSATATAFPATIPEGRLHYRELVTKNHKDMKFFSIAQLGTQLAASNDLYTCAAKRYYQFFTGVNVDLTQVATAAIDKVHQDKVIALGKTFKSHQSVRLLLKDIFASDAFRASNYLTEK
jgi:hypothetical protein